MTNHTKPSGALRSLRARNRSLVIDVLRHEGSASRAEIARRTGLSRATISSLVADLQREGLVVEGRAGPAQPGAQVGRPGVLLSLEVPAGIDFASDHVDVAIADLSSRVLADAGVTSPPTAPARSCSTVPQSSSLRCSRRPAWTVPP